MCGVMLVTAGGGTALSVTPNSSIAEGFSTHYKGTVTTSPPTILTISGGVAPYTVLWTQTDGPTINISSDTNTTVTFFDYFIDDGIIFATWEALVEDSVGDSATVSIFVTLASGGGL